MLAQLVYGFGLFKLFERMKLKKCLTNVTDRILKIECKLQHFTRNCRIKNLDDFERDEADA